MSLRAPSPCRRAALALLLLVIAPALAGAAESRPPNVVLLLSDQHRWHAMGHTESPVKTPAMDRMSAEGVAVRHAISNLPLCGPARAMILTGRWPYQTGVVDNKRFPAPSEPSLARDFRAAGYRTGYIGKWHLGGRDARPFGFDHSIVWLVTDEHWSSSFVVDGGDETIHHYGYNATGTTDQALSFIERNAAQPFFLMVSWNPPHTRYDDPPDEKRGLYNLGNLPFRANVGDRYRRRRKIEETHVGYHAHVSAIDDELARILEGLEERGLTRDTLVVYTSDHGAMLGSHGLERKRHPHAESIRVPFLAHWPGTLAPRALDDLLLGLLDLKPTLLGLAGLPVPESSVGHDLSARLRGASEEPAPAFQPIMHVEYKRKKSPSPPYFRGVKTPRFTYAIGVDGPMVLFDDIADPLQQNNLAEDPSLADVRRRLTKITADWLVEAEDPFEIPENAAR